MNKRIGYLAVPLIITTVIFSVLHITGAVLMLTAYNESPLVPRRAAYDYFEKYIEEG